LSCEPYSTPYRYPNPGMVLRNESATYVYSDSRYPTILRKVIALTISRTPVELCLEALKKSLLLDEKKHPISGAAARAAKVLW
jgi:hypothetical protein